MKIMEEQEENYHEDIQMGNNEDGYAEGTEVEEVSGSEEEDASENESVASEDDATVISKISTEGVNQAIDRMKAEQGGQASILAERPKAGSTAAPLQSQNVPKPAGQRYPGASHRQAPGRAQYGVRNPNGSYPLLRLGRVISRMRPTTTHSLRHRSQQIENLYAKRDENSVSLSLKSILCFRHSSRTYCHDKHRSNHTTRTFLGP
jgi:hypothetical protein